MLGIYRILFGMFMTYNIYRYFRIGLVENMFVLPRINFSYDGFHWLKPMPEYYMYVLLTVLLICGVLMTTGIWFKWACRVFALGYLYLFLLDKSLYNNHIYLFILVAILLSFTDADKVYSPGAKKYPNLLVPRWQQFILQAQIIIVYFYGGIAKLTYDWVFNAEPVRSLVQLLSHDQILNSIFNNEAGIQFINFGGLALDLGAPFLLWYKPFRKWSVWIFVMFNFTNSRLFQDIGIFPFVMLANLLLFYDAAELPFIRKGIKINVKQSSATLIPSSTPAPKYFLMGYFIFQLLFPFRGHFLPNPLDWTTIGNRFSWRMKVDTRSAEKMEFYIYSPDFQGPVPVEVQTFINDVQIRHLAMDPRSIRDFAKFLENEALAYQTKEPVIKANIDVRYNGRAAVRFVNPELNLADVTYSPFKRLTWVNDVPR
jgi:hypothetical protein